MNLNLANFLKLQGNKTEQEMAEEIGISRTQLWRVKTKRGSVGIDFITKFKKRFPKLNIDDYFF